MKWTFTCCRLKTSDNGIPQVFPPGSSPMASRYGPDRRAAAASIALTLLAGYRYNERGLSRGRETVRVDVAELQRQPGARQKVALVEDVGPGPDEDCSFGPAEVQAELANTGSGISLTGVARARARLRCSRCLKEFDAMLEAPLKERFRETLRSPGGDAGLEGDEDEDVIPYDGRQIDLREPVREGLVLAVPMQPLCEPTCPGLCPTCGIDRHRAACTCAPEPADPRLAALRRLAQDDRSCKERC